MLCLYMVIFFIFFYVYVRKLICFFLIYVFLYFEDNLLSFVKFIEFCVLVKVIIIYLVLICVLKN